jgi:hypothetical protein
MFKEVPMDTLDQPYQSLGGKRTAFVPAADAWVPVGPSGGPLLVLWHIGAAVRLLRIRRG